MVHDKEDLLMRKFDSRSSTTIDTMCGLLASISSSKALVSSMSKLCPPRRRHPRPLFSAG
jgi:hypothetical protein